MTMLSVADILRTAGAPALVTAVLLFLLTEPDVWRWLPPGHRLHRWRSVAAWPLALAIGYIVGHAAGLRLTRADLWFPKVSQDWLPWLAAAAALIAVAPRLPGPKWVPWLAWGFLAALTPPLLTRSIIEYQWSVPQAAVWLTVLGTALLAVMMLLRGRGDGVMPPLWALLALMVAATLVMSGSQKLGQLGLALAATLTAAAAAAWWTGGLAQARLAGPMVAMLLAGLLIVGHWYASLTGVNAILLGGALLFTADAPITPASWGRRWRVAARVGLTTALGGAAVALALRGFLEDLADPYYLH
jgi:hypothetical protein